MKKNETAKMVKAEQVAARLGEMFGEGTRFVPRTVIKANEILTGVTLIVPGVSLLPTDYLEMFPEDSTVEELANRMAVDFQEILRSWSQEGKDQIPEIDRDFILEHVFIQALGLERNRALARSYVTVPLLDMIGVIRFAVPPWKKGSLRSSMLDPRILKALNLSVEELTMAAVSNNSRLFGVEVFDAKKACEISADDWRAEPFETFRMNRRRKYTLTNNIHLNGAGFLFCPQVLARMGEKLGCDYYVIPSSIHEAQIHPVPCSGPVEEIRARLYHFNRVPEVVPPGDVLTDTVYRWRVKHRALGYA